MKSIQLSKDEANQLERWLIENDINYINTKNPYEKVRVKEKNLNFILYNSLKLVYNESNEMEELLEKILKTEGDYYDYIIGSDETGKGEWYGPLVVVAVALEPNQINYFRKLGIKDSKLLKIEKVLELAKKIIEEKQILFHKVILKPYIYNEKYSEFKKENKNLNDLLAWAHSAAIKELLNRVDYENSILKIIIDKFDFFKTDYRLKNIKSQNIKIIQKTKGESETAVALASILAKYYFENTLKELNDEYNLNLKKVSPKDIPKELLPNVAKIHFKNINILYNQNL